MSNELLHPNVWPPLPRELTGGIILDLKDNEVQQQLANLLQTDELDSDLELATFLKNRIQAIKQNRGGEIDSTT